MGAQLLGHVRFFATQWAIDHQAPVNMGFSRQEYWSGLPFPSPGDLPDSGIEPKGPLIPALAGGFFTIEPPAKPLQINVKLLRFYNSAEPWHKRCCKMAVLEEDPLLCFG